MKTHEHIEVIGSEKKTNFSLSQVPTELSKTADIQSHKPLSISDGANLIDSCAEFYAFYGLLDGLSVSYSSLKFFCEIFTASAKEYSDVMKMLLFEPAWIAVVSICTVFIAGMSLFANYLSKFDPSKIEKNPNPTNYFEHIYLFLQTSWQQFCSFLKERNIVDSWEYVRNLSKGIKNGFKGTKGFIALFLATGFMDKTLFSTIFFPISLTVGVICMINRAWNITMKLNRKKLSKKCDKAIKNVKELNVFLEEKQTHKNRLRFLSARINHIEVLEKLAKKNGIRSFGDDSNSKISSAEREIKQTTGLSGCRSSTNFQQLKTKATDRNKIELEFRKLLTSPELFEQEQIVATLQKSLQVEGENDNVFQNFDKLKHPLAEKLVKEQERLKELRTKVDTDKIYTLQELGELFESHKQELSNCINKRKNEDKHALIKLISGSDKLDDFWQEFNVMLAELSQSEVDNFETYKEVFSNGITKFHKQLLANKERLKHKSTLDDATIEKLLQSKKEQEEAIYQLFVDYDLMDQFGAQLIFNQLRKDASSLHKYAESIQFNFLISNIIAGIVDAPYLYVGVMSLALITVPSILMAMTISVVAFTIISVFFRAYEEVESNDACKLQQLKANIALCDNKWKLAQNRYYKAFEKYKLDNHVDMIDGTEHAQKFKEETEQANIVPSLIETYNASQEAREELKAFIEPSLYAAIMHGAKDALSFYGAIASTFYALNILLMAFGIAFPPILVIGAITAGITALIGFISLRFYITLKIRQDLESQFQIKKVTEDELYHDKPSLPLGWTNTDTDGLTKGEMFFQELHEIIRSIGAGFGGKAVNLSDFLLSHFKEASDNENKPLAIAILFLTVLLCIIYGAVLALRAFARGFTKFKGLSHVSKEGSELIDISKGDNASELNSLDSTQSLATIYDEDFDEEASKDELLSVDTDEANDAFSRYTFFKRNHCMDEESRELVHSPSLFSQTSIA